jgi:hypothetical protein
MIEVVRLDIPVDRFIVMLVYLAFAFAAHYILEKALDVHLKA